LTSKVAAHAIGDLSGFTENHNFTVNLTEVNKIAPNVITLVATYIYILYSAYSRPHSCDIYICCSAAKG
jgi:hypothetical protein